MEAPLKEPAITVTVDGHAYTDTGTSRGKMTLSHLHTTSQGVVIASHVAAVTSTVGRLFRTELPLVRVSSMVAVPRHTGVMAATDRHQQLADDR